MRATCLRLKITFDPWQEGAAAAILGKREDGLYAADAVVISIPRQVGKTFLIGAIVFALCLQSPGLLCVWTAHRYPTANETFESMRAMSQRPELKPHIRKATMPAGNGVIEFNNGSRILFGARERGFGRGIPKIGVIVFDEAQILGQNAVDDMVPAANQAANALVFHIGTPPKPSDPSEVFVNLRHEALTGDSTDTLYIEFSADPDADPTDREQWAKANPSYPHRTPARAMRRMHKSLGPASFMREALGVWDATLTGVFTAGAWAKCATTDDPPKQLAALGVSADLDQTRLALGGVSVEEPRHLGAILRSRFDSEREHFVSEVARISKEQGVPVAIDKKGPAAALIQDLVEAGAQVVTIGLDERVQFSADIRDAVENGRVRHGNYPELNDAVDAATWGHSGDRRLFRRKGGDIAMLEAVTDAYGIASTNYDVLQSAY